jgi:4-amino-4-deoxy-L-arabinose transferase-like glycosyltransferase
MLASRLNRLSQGIEGSMRAVFRFYGLPAFLIAIAAALALWRLESAPPLWWDEGWTLSVARNWVERGHYGRLLNGEPTTTTLSAALSVTTPIALSFKLFGVGIWQGRIVGVVFMVGALGLLYHITAHLYQRSIAIGALLCSVVLFPNAEIHPSYLSRQVLGELPMLFYLLLGYAAWLAALREGRGAWGYLLLALVSWGLAINAKAQTLPFFAASLLTLPLWVAVRAKHWRMVALLVLGFAGAYSFARTLQGAQPFLLPGYVRTTDNLQELYNVTAFVPDVKVRLLALWRVLLYGSPVVLGLIYAAWHGWRELRAPERSDWQMLGRLSFLSLVGSWLLWFGGLSAGWLRYFFPVVFIGNLFAAALLYDWTDSFNLRAMWRNAMAALTCKREPLSAAKTLSAILLLAFMLLLATRAFYQFYRSDNDDSVVQAAHALNATIPTDALLETYDSELFIWLTHRYHYPPDQVHIALIRAQHLDIPLAIAYNPLTVNVDYLVVGPFSRWVRLYEPTLASGAFRLWRIVGRYEIYERIR